MAGPSLTIETPGRGFTEVEVTIRLPVRVLDPENYDEVVAAFRNRLVKQKPASLVGDGLMRVE